MKPVIDNKTVKRIQEITNEPISRGFDKSLNQCLDELERLRKLNGKSQVLSCDRMEELTQ